MVLLTATPVFSHAGSSGHQHSSIEQFFIGLAYAAIVFFVALVVGILVKSRSTNVKGDNV